MSAENLEGVLAFLPILEEPGRQLYTVTSGQMDPYRYAPQVDQLIEQLYRVGLVFDFDWQSYIEEAERFQDRPELLATADLATLRKLLTTHVRAERFNGGHLATLIDSGHLLAILRRLREIGAG